jgi:iron complex outermembrane receptor protein
VLLTGNYYYYQKRKSGRFTSKLYGNLQVAEITKKVDALSPTQFRDFITANGTPAQQALVGAVDTDWQNEIYRTEQITILL